jgi:hypothetical protein
VEGAITLAAEPGDHAGLELLRGHEVIAFRESVRDGRVTWADDEGGIIATTIKGPTPQGEDDSLVACRILIRKMNQMGNAWSEPVEVRPPSDRVTLIAWRRI